MADGIDVPEEWRRLLLRELGDRVVVIGAPGVGKSSFCRWLYTELSARQGRVAFLDGDPGQSQLGPPTTITMALGGDPSEGFPPAGEHWRWFVGSTSPVGHMLPLLVGVARLADRARDHGATSIILDTTGLIDPGQGGHALKWALMDILRPSTVVAIAYRDELRTLLRPVAARGREAVIELPPSPRARPRSRTERRDHRIRQFREYFRHSERHRIAWAKMGVFPNPQFERQRLFSIEDRAGFTLGLAIMIRLDQSAKEMTFQTPLSVLDAAAAIRLGDLLLDPSSFNEREERIGQEN